MVVKKRRKSVRMRGSATHGWGKNKHRNSGSRGGFGNAGTGKKSHNKKPSIWAEDYFGKQGFISKSQRKAAVVINLRDVQDRLPKWVAMKNASVVQGVFVVDLGKLGFTKLLSAGRMAMKLKLIVDEAAEGVVEKVKAAGGEVVLNESV
ncbi:uL15 family ribosomal protein [Candidatus Woesearchaeota archaeon]|nr:uL15 family ribosomal protein [Candidatus Woesearchaeota archaeon]